MLTLSALPTQPCVVHANGWDKEPLLQILLDAGELSRSEWDAMEGEKAALEKSKVCTLSTPFPSSSLSTFFCLSLPLASSPSTTTLSMPNHLDAAKAGKGR